MINEAQKGEFSFHRLKATKFYCLHTLIHQRPMYATNVHSDVRRRLEDGFPFLLVMFTSLRSAWWKIKSLRNTILKIEDINTVAVLAQSVERVDCRAGGRKMFYE